MALNESSAAAGTPLALPAAGDDEWVQRALERLASQPSLDHLLLVSLEMFAQRMGDGGGTIWIYDPAIEATRPALNIEPGAVECSPWRDPVDPAQVRRDWDREWLPALRRGEVLVHGEEVLMNSPGNMPYRQGYVQRRVKTSLVVPLALGGELLGFAAARSGHRRDFTQQEIEAARRLARQISLALYLTRLADEALERAREAAMLAERNRIAGEIHDSLAQALTGVVLQLQAARAAAAAHPCRSPAENLALAEELARDGLAEARRSFLALRPVALEAGNLGQALEQLAHKACVPGRVVCAYTGETGPLPLRPDEEDAAFRIAQEAVQNALRHGRPTRVELSLCSCSDGISMTIDDDGRGIGADTLARRGGAGGLRSMRERAWAVGAEFRIEPLLPNGTRVAVVFPVSFA